ncbi:hypothetical protein BBK36DRAFT_1194095 [Trichoderma citrinoviride]|uniref:DUF6546 domain-containing protein n=1 Tax=Trichoderma citrinoviride TaxID=58853 RepID=A0A2T4BEY6_9HYPO|nr:hypothetical protein BBK36DRAFT_1194095 [Trichoderma citrinoviride]PTB67876.1 hypothetical protein BBK36DRAFT_1194095 [Trichoderma citrinoviride]
MPLPSLPAEVRGMILEALVRDGRELAPLATVSREWQAVIEPQTFKRIRVTPSRIAELDDMTRRNRSHVRYLWLCLELERYGCDTCSPCLDHGEDPLFNSAADDLLIKTAIQSLLFVLSTWDRSSSLALDISVYSVSDQEHWFKYLTFEPDDDENDAPGDQGYSCITRVNQAAPGVVDDPRHRWNTTDTESYLAARAAVQNVFTHILDNMSDESDDEQRDDPEWWREIPVVPAITRLLLRQQTRRRWQPEALAGLLARFPRLCELHFEPWREWDDLLQSYADESYLTLFRSPSIQRLSRFTIFENFNERYVEAYWEGDCSRIRPPNSELSRVLYAVSGNHESLSASFVVDADAFFAWDEGQPPNRWPNLRHLFLTSQLLAPDQDEARITSMLRAAARAAVYMPKLETLQIWNGRRHLAALFKYEAATEQGQASTITWRGTWEFLLPAPVIQAWQSLASEPSPLGLRVIYESIGGDEVRCHGDAMLLLELPELVIRRVSLRQILNEQLYIPLEVRSSLTRKPMLFFAY